MKKIRLLVVTFGERAYIVFAGNIHLYVTRRRHCVATAPWTQKHTDVKKRHVDTVSISSMQCAVRDLGCQTVYRHIDQRLFLLNM